MKIVLAVLLLALFVSAQVETPKGFLKGNVEGDDLKGPEDDDFKKSFSVICRSKNYPFESHKVLTKDGYWLTMFRIPGSKGQTRDEAVAQHKPAIFLQHGVLDSADTWIMNYEASAPAFMLANQGYDVWLGNTRGNKYSRDHQWLDPDDKVDGDLFWNYSFEEMSLYDVEANIEYIQSITKKTQVAVVAHSQGTSQMLIKMSDHNDWWNENVSIFVCLAGVARLEHCSSKLLTTLAKQQFAIDTLKKIGIREMMPADYLQNQVFSRVCKVVPFVCDFVIQLISDEDAGLDNQKRLSNFMGHYPAGTSLKSLEHFAQIINAEQFQRFDYGPEKNMEKYGQKTPPIIDLSQITGAKVVMIGGDSDMLADPVDVKWLKEQLGENVMHFASYPLGHMSYLLAEDMQYFKDVQEILSQNPWE